MREFDLPPAITELVEARKRVRAHYHSLLHQQGSKVDLNFTLDGNLIGDIGEALAAQLFGIRLVDAKSTEGIDGYTPDGQSTVQVKTTGTGRGPAFRCVETRADYLLFFDLDLERCKGAVVFNGPERYATDKLPTEFRNQRSLTPKQIRDADQLVGDDERLPLVEMADQREPRPEWSVELTGSLRDDLEARIRDKMVGLGRPQAGQPEIAEQVDRLLTLARNLEEEVARLRQQISVLANSASNVPDDDSYLQLEVVAGSPRELKGLKVEVFANEHPPPHFRVKLQASTANFRISDCERLNGSGEVLRHERTIRSWWKDHKTDLIEAWDKMRPSDCPVGTYSE